MKEVYSNIYQVQIPLMNSPLKELNCFIVKGEKRNLVVDTGFNQPLGRETLLNALKELGCDLDLTDVFITHLHSDHSGLTGAIKNDINRAYASSYDAASMNRMFAMSDSEYNSSSDSNEMGFPIVKEDKMEGESHPGFKNRCERVIDFTIVKEGDVIDLGGFVFEVVDMAGHTPGQVGLYDRTHKVMFCGDHILGKITPNITYWLRELDSLGQYMDNLKKVREMEVDHLFSAHRYLVDNHKERVDALLEHHARRLDEVRDIISKEPTNVYNTAAGMKWDFAGGNFLAFPITQKWFAAGEAYSHLEHLRHTGEATFTEDSDGVLLYSLVK